mgnify:CR=1 FL=1
MARIRQQHPQNYGSSGNINTEFEALIRYLNSAELGNKTIAELMKTLFNEDGQFDGPIEFRRDTDGGIQYRVGEFSREDAGWNTLARLDELRGEPGEDFGEIGAPILYSREDFTATSGQTDFEYGFDEDNDELLVYVDGVLQVPGNSADYIADPSVGSAGGISFNAGLSAGEVVTAYKIRATAITGFKRSDIETVDSQAVFPFEFDENTRLQVYKNGILQREGGSYDYTVQPLNNTVTFNTPLAAGNLVTIITVENNSVRAVTGMMFEENFVHTDTGLIRYDKIQIADDAIPQDKVSGLTTEINTKAKITVSATTPVSAASPDLWLDTSQSPNQLKFFDGTQWLRTSPDSSLPTFTTTQAGQYVRVNGTGTALEYGGIDFSSLIPITQKGAANGVASLDSSGRLPTSQLPSVLASDSYYKRIGTPAAEGYGIKRVYRQKIRIEGLALQTTSGTCNVQVAVEGTGYGSAYSVSSTPNEFVLGTPIEVDSSSSSSEIGFIVSNISSTSELEVTMAVSIIAA